MSWARGYRVALHLLPAGLRRKHGAAMEALFGRELERARAHGRLHEARAGAGGVWDVLRRGAYERLRPRRDAAGERGDHRPRVAWPLHAPAPHPAGAHPGAPRMPQPTTRQLLRGHAASFAVAFVALTAALLAPFAWRQVPRLAERGEAAGAIVEMLLLAVPFVAALTIPMAVLVAVLWQFTRLGREGTLAAARREPAGVRRLVAPVLAAAAVAGVATLLVGAQVVPHTNARLSAVLAGQPASPAGTAVRSDRAMTIGELRAAARDVRPGTGAVVLRQVAQYEVEVQKKLALAAACVVLALAGMAIVLHLPRGGATLAVVASIALVWAYYALLVGGEALADDLVVSPVVGMWGANALLLTLALLTLWWRRAPRGAGPVTIG